MDASFQPDFLLCYHAVSSMLPPPAYRFLMLVIGKSTLFLLSVVVLFSSFERPSTPLRIWASVCLIHVLLHCLLKHYTMVRISDHPSDTAAAAEGNCICSSVHYTRASQRIIKRLEAMSEIMASVLWSIACYWTGSGGLSVLDYSLSLRWLKMVFLSFEGSNMLQRITTTVITFLFVLGCHVVPATEVRKYAYEDDIKCLPKYNLSTIANDIKQGAHFAISSLLSISVLFFVLVVL